MTKEELRQFRAWGKEIKIERARLTSLRRERKRHEAAAIAVQGSLPYLPYTQHSIFIGTGASAHQEYTSEINALENRIERLLQKRRRVREYIDSIPDSETRQIFTLRYLEGSSWQQISQKMGHSGDGSTERKQHDRYLKFPEIPEIP